MSNWKYGDDELLTPSEVAGEFKVDPKTVTRWAKAGRIPSLPAEHEGGEPIPSVIRTPGGHVRIRAVTVRKILNGEIRMTYNDQDRETVTA